MATSTEFIELGKLSPMRATANIAGDWLLITLCFVAAAIVPHPLVYLVSFLLIARTQIALALLMHDASHGLLAKNRQLNDYIGQFFCAAPIFFSLFSYRANHLKHHQVPLTPDDPDITLIAGYPVTPTSLMRKLGRDAVGISYFKFIRYFLYGSHRRRKQMAAAADTQIKKARVGRSMPLGMVVFSIVATNAVILGALWLGGHPWLFLGLWVLPMMTLVQVLLRIRGIAEHAGFEPNRNQALCSRTVLSSWQAFWFAPHSANYHIEHHIHIMVPCYRLKRLHAVMRQRGDLPEHRLYRNYGEVLRELVKPG